MLNEAIHRRIHWVLVIVLAFLLPFCMCQKVRFTGIAIILLASNMLLSGLWRKIVWRQLGIYSVSIFALFLLTGIGFLYSENLKSAGQLLESRVMLFALPMIFWVMGYPDKRLFNAILWSVLGGVLVSTLIIFKQGIAPFTNYELNQGCYSCVMELLIPMHRPYYGLLMVISIAFCLSQMKQVGLLGKALLIIGILYLGALVFLMLPKMVLISTLIGIVVLIMKLLTNRASGFAKVLFGGVAVGIVIGILGAITLITNKEEKSTNTLQSSVVSRKLLWEAAAHSLSDPVTFLVGVGLGDESDQLTKYIQENHPNQFEKSLNAHNQYLAEWLKFGLLGLAATLIIGIYPVYSGWQNSNNLTLFIAVLWGLNLLTENYLNREAGLLTLGIIILPMVYLEKSKFETTKN